MKSDQYLPHQAKAIKQCTDIFKHGRTCYLAGEVRVGKTRIAFGVADQDPFIYEVLFVTKKNAIKDIQKQFAEFDYDFCLTVINYEQIKNIDFDEFDFLILDEAHTLGAYPKPSKRARYIREQHFEGAVLLMSGTPSPESFSQLYHQLWAVGFTPWLQYRNFYKWAKLYVNVTQDYFGGPLPINNYDDAHIDMIKNVVDPIMVSVTQQDAKFKGTVLEHVHTIPLHESTILHIKELVKTGVCPTLHLYPNAEAQKMSMVHQLCSGTVIDTDRCPIFVDDAKIKYIKRTWPKKKMAIFYVYIEEGDALKRAFKNWTDNALTFANTDLHFICQVKAGQEGTDLSSADVLIFYNIHYSASSYFQARARQQKYNKGDVTVHWLFSDYGFEKRIYNLIQNGKKVYTLAHFRKDYSNTGSKKIAFGRVASH